MYQTQQATSEDVAEALVYMLSGVKAQQDQAETYFATLVDQNAESLAIAYLQVLADHQDVNVESVSVRSTFTCMSHVHIEICPVALSHSVSLCVFLDPSSRCCLAEKAPTQRRSGCMESSL